jgi:DNA-binding NtrC family response regulator
MKRKILLIEDEPSMRLGVSHTLNNAGYFVAAFEDGSSGLKALGEGEFEMVITDFRLPDIDGLQVMEKVQEIDPEIGVLIITGYPQVETAVSAIKHGAHDYISKPFSNEELLLVVSRFFRFKELKQENVHLKKTIHQKSTLEQFIYESTSMKKVMDLVAAVADTDVPVRIFGESGTGKELVTNALHNLGARKDKPFLKINCAAIPENLLESELFGHERGAFTGAFKTQKGKFEIANGGTIFFDEIGDLPLSLQPKLLRVLEDHTVLRIGSATPIKINVRMIFATGKNLKDLIAENLFREDLFYRINVVPIELPPLRERNEDIPALISYFQHLYEKKYNKESLTIPPHVYSCLLNYDYPGNVRELKNIIERAVLLSKGKYLKEETLPEAIRGGCGKILPPIEDLPLEEGIKAYEKQRIIKALIETDGKKIKAAERLGISRKVLWKKMKDLDIDQDSTE